MALKQLTDEEIVKTFKNMFHYGVLEGRAAAKLIGEADQTCASIYNVCRTTASMFGLPKLQALQACKELMIESGEPDPRGDIAYVEKAIAEEGTKQQQSPVDKLISSIDALLKELPPLPKEEKAESTAYNFKQASDITKC